MPSIGGTALPVQEDTWTKILVLPGAFQVSPIHAVRKRVAGEREKDG